MGKLMKQMQNPNQEANETYPYAMGTTMQEVAELRNAIRTSKTDLQRNLTLHAGAIVNGVVGGVNESRGKRVDRLQLTFKKELENATIRLEERMDRLEQLQAQPGYHYDLNIGDHAGNNS